MAKEKHSHDGNEVVLDKTIQGARINVYGCFSKGTPIGRYDFYDVYIEMDGIFHCMNEGDPFYRKPSVGEIKDLMDTFLES